MYAKECAKLCFYKLDWMISLQANNTLSFAGQHYDGDVKPKFNVNQVAVTQVMFEGLDL